jgi:hypothetical protein
MRPSTLYLKIFCGVLFATVGVYGTALSSAQALTTVVLTSGTTWTVPDDWNSFNNTIEVIGAGAGGGRPSNGGTNGAGAGGGGGYSSISNFALTLGASITFQLGAAGAGATANGTNGGQVEIRGSMAHHLRLHRWEPKAVREELLPKQLVLAVLQRRVLVLQNLAEVTAEQEEQVDLMGVPEVEELPRVLREMVRKEATEVPMLAAWRVQAAEAAVPTAVALAEMLLLIHRPQVAIIVLALAAG